MSGARNAVPAEMMIVLRSLVVAHVARAVETPVNSPRIAPRNKADLY
jgi:hypothetical protein